jgi:arylsulfatase A-like enzyme
MKHSVLIFGTATAAFLTTTFAESRPPNIIHIMADDLGWRDLSVYGSETFATPNLDRLAEMGKLFTDAYASSPLCSPTRAATLTGQTVSRIRITSPTGHIGQVILDPVESPTASPGFPMTIPQNRSRIPFESVTVGQVFKDAGYATAFLGKWHLGHDPYIPENFGFDFVIGGRGTPGPPQGRFFGPWDPEADNVPMVEGSPNIDDVLGDYAVQFIADNRDNPFLLKLWLYNPHAPFRGVPEVIESYRPAAERAAHQQSAIMASMVKTIDDNVGKVMKALEREGLFENTILIFTSDNGGNMYDRPDGVNPTSNHPLRAGKGNNYEGGVRVPLIVAWPGQIESGAVSGAVSTSYDWFPTFLELAGLNKPVGWQFDGMSLVPALMGEPFERGPIFFGFPHTVVATGNVANFAVRDGEWKLYRFFFAGREQQDVYELYNLNWDIGETTNLVHQHPEVAERLKGILQRQLDDEQALLPRRNPDFDPDFEQAGFRIIHGGYLVGGGSRTQASVTAFDAKRLTLSYDLSTRGYPGDELAFTLTTNCVVNVTAAPEGAQLFGPPVNITPDLTAQEVRIPLARRSESGRLMVHFDLEQPGRLQISNPRMIDGGIDSFTPPRVVEGLPTFYLEGPRPGTVGDFLPSNHIAKLEVQDGKLLLRSSASDPFIISENVRFPPSAVDVIEVEMRSGKAGYAELFWTVDNQYTYGRARVIRLDVPTGREWQTLRFNVGQHPNWRGQVINSLRFDPINQANTDVEIRAIRAYKN